MFESESEYVRQLIGFLGTVTMVGAILLIGGIITDRFSQKDYRLFKKHLAAKKRWAEMLNPFHKREE